MSEVVDSIIAELDVRYAKYVKGFNEAIAVNDRFGKSVERLKRLGMEAPPQYAAGIAREAGKGAAAHEAAATRMSRTTKKRTADEVAAAEAVKRAAKETGDAERTAAKAAADAVKAAEREKQAAIKATAREQEKVAKAALAAAEAQRVAAAAVIAAQERETAQRVRLAEVVDRAANRRTNQIAPAANSTLGATVPRETSGQRGIPTSVLNGGVAAEVEAEKEINHLLADQATLSSRLGILKGKEKQQVADQVAELRLINSLERAGLEQSEIGVRLDERRTLIARQRSIEDRKQGARGVTQFARGAGVSSLGAGSIASIAGVTLASGVAITAAVVQSAADYAKELKNVSEQIGLTTQQTQVYEAEARRLGVSQNELRNGLGQFADYLGRAKSGGEDQIKTFKALGLSVKDFANAGDALPAIIARISSIPDAAQRAAVETRLFGEEGRKLDALLSGGNERINELAEGMLKAGTILSAADIARLASVSKELERVKSQLQVSVAGVVADNADAIIGLANSFGKLVNDIREAVAWIQTFNSQKLQDLSGGKPLAPDLIVDSQNAYERLFKQGSGFFGSQLVSQQRKPDMVTGETRAFLERIKGASVPAGAVDTKLRNSLNAPKPPRGPKGKSAETIANEADQRTRQFNEQIGRYQDERLAAVAEQTSDENVRRQLQREQIDRDSARAAEDIRLHAQQDIRKGGDARLINARRDQAIAAERAASDEKIQVINLADTLSTIQRRAAAETDVLTFADDILRAQRDLATTTEQRRDIDKQLLDNAMKREAIGANVVLRRSEEGDPSITRQDIESANRTINTQTARTAIQTKQIDRANESPLDAYRRELHEATDDTNAAFQSIEVNALQRLEDQISSSIGKVLGLKGAFGDLFGSVLADIARLELKKGILSLFNQGGEGGSGGGIGGLVAGVGKLFGGRASGGNVVGGGNYLVGENGPEILSMPSSGRVYPNGALPGIAGRGGGGTTLHQTVHIDASGVNPEGYTAGILGIVRRETNSALRQASKQTLDAVPGRIQRFSNLGS
ncbi:hypothetical protein ASE82_09440 [Sphingomonas sp. Leaf230]|uniref:hypothetical protein n=1 Tax=Sphingomonas sp. Leaf230 TaxID=1735694 RepID=UPI0006FC28F8|nr:hypothetical protein [Sphingomonas sp. Leaf230]KQN02549.1 hypothetical protein ASE82_09440 [Sphingomonas sp. Leaf230]